MRSMHTRGKTGPATRSIACRARRVVGVTGKIFRGSPCDRSWSLKSHTSTCRAIVFVTPRNFVAGALIRNRKTARTSNSRSCHHTKSSRYSRAADNAVNDRELFGEDLLEAKTNVVDGFARKSKNDSRTRETSSPLALEREGGPEMWRLPAFVVQPRRGTSDSQIDRRAITCKRQRHPM